ncbi:MAG: hypothetical protein HYU86_04200 [Chloroflexi bacterium]|nr:hypothetical protein [Chloroflexota bacterium]
MAFGFQAILVSAEAHLVDETWIGQRLGKDFSTYLDSLATPVDPCGEGFHTLVTNGPLSGRVKS